MDNLLLLIVCLLGGIALRAFRKLPENTPAVLNAIVLYLAMPALTLHQLHALQFHPALIFPAAVTWICFLAGVPFFLLLARHLKLDRGTLGAILMTACFGNTSFLGFPILQALYGPQSLEVGIIVDQPGSFLLLTTLGLVVVTLCAPQAPTRATLRRLLGFPPMIAFLATLLLRPFSLPPAVLSLFEKLGSLLVPLALLSISFHLRGGANFRILRPEEMRAVAWGLAYKLILSPLLIFALYSGVFGLRGRATQIMILEAAMAPMITSGILALEYGLNPRIVAAMFGIGIPLSLLTVACWAWFLTP